MRISDWSSDVCSSDLDDEATDPLRTRLAGTHHRHIDVVDPGARNELLGAVDDIMVALQLRAGLERRGVGPRSGFGQAIARVLVHGNEAGQEFRLHLGAAEGIDHPADRKSTRLNSSP